LILKKVKVVCFETLLQVLILNGLEGNEKWSGSGPSGLHSKLGTSRASGRKAETVAREKGGRKEFERTHAFRAS
jgi:hypothetical protein